MEFWKGPPPADSGQVASAAPSPKEDSAPVRLVIDTPVFLVAARSPSSSSRRVLDAVSAGRATLLVDPAVFMEYRQRLPQALESNDHERLIRAWISRAESVPADRKRAPAQPIHTDKFVALAVEGRADAIVSNDEQRLLLRRSVEVPVLRPDEAVRLLR